MKKGHAVSIVLAIVFSGLFFLSPDAAAASPIIRFVFTTDAQIVRAGELSGAMTMQAQDVGGSAQASDETIDLVFSSSSPLGEFLNASGEPVKTAMSKGTANRTFYYRDTAAGTATVSVRATSRTSGQSWIARQDIVITAVGEVLPSSVANTAVASPPSAAAVSSYHAPVMPLPPPPAISAFAGEDREALAGVEENFVGEAVGFIREPITNARFWWNFGDGSTAEGRSVGHIYREPGIYTAALSVSSGEYAASDYAAVRVLPNKIAVAGVITGENGAVRITNPSSVNADIGGWGLADDHGKTFFLPAHTIIGAGGEASFPNRTTGLSPDKKVFLRYASGSIAADGEATGENAYGKDTAASSSLAAVLPLVGGIGERDGVIGHKSATVAFAATATPARNSATSMASADSAANNINFPRVFFIGAFALSIFAAVGFFFARSIIL